MLAPPFETLLLFVASAAGGALNSVAGGGSFLTFPALLFAGVAPVSANATSTVALWPGSLAGAYAYRHDFASDRKTLTLLSIVSLVGGGVGAYLLLRTSDTTFVVMVPWLLLVATLLFSFGGPIAAKLRARPASKHALLWTGVAQFFIAIYGGYFGGGQSILMLAALAVLGMTNIHTMNALKTGLGAMVNGVAIALFVIAGTVTWAPALVMILGAAIGGYAGARIARKVDPARVKKLVLVFAWGLTAYFFWKYYGVPAKS